MTDLVSMRRPITGGLIALLVLVLGLGVWSVTARLAGGLVVTGRVTTDQIHLPIQHPDGGVVAHVYVTEGEEVAAGQVLLSLAGSALRSELRLLDTRWAELAARSARLEAVRLASGMMSIPPALQARASADPAFQAILRGQADLLAAQRATQAELTAQLERRVAQIHARIRGLLAQGDALRQQLALVEQDLVDQKRLAHDGLVLRTRLLALEHERIELIGDIGALDASVAEASAMVAEVEMQITTLALRAREDAEAEWRDLEAQLLELDERRSALNDRLANLQLRAPVAGVVLGLKTVAGSVLRGAEPALALVPTDRPIIVTARVPPARSDQVSVGQAVELRPMTPSGRVTAPLSGQVTQISPDTVTDPVTGNEAFILQVALAPDASDHPDAEGLTPGVPVELLLRTKERSPLAYILEPFTAYFARALRES